MARRSRGVSKKRKYTMGTVWFLAIIVLAVIGASPGVLNREILWLLLSICGALVAMYNIKKNEEVTFLVAAATLLIIVICMQVSPTFSITTFVDTFVFNLGVAFGTAAFVVALAIVAKLGLDK